MVFVDLVKWKPITRQLKSGTLPKQFRCFTIRMFRKLELCTGYLIKWISAIRCLRVLIKAFVRMHAATIHGNSYRFFLSRLTARIVVTT